MRSSLSKRSLSARPTSDAVRSSRASRCATRRPRAAFAYRSSHRAWSSSPRVAVLASQATSSDAGSNSMASTNCDAFRCSCRSERHLSKKSMARTRSAWLEYGQTPARPSPGNLVGQSNALANLTFLVEQVGEPHTVEHRVDLLLQQHPHGPDAAGLRRRAALLLYGVRHAVEVERLQLGRGDDVAHRDLPRLLRERVAAMGAPRALHDVGAPQAQEDLLDVIDRQLLPRRDFAAGDRPLAIAAGQVQRADHAVLGERRDSHVRRIV